jgi:thiamine-monophosphate kinase
MTIAGSNSADGPTTGAPTVSEPSAFESAGADDTLGRVAERETLRRIFPRLPQSDAALLGPGDDAAVLSAPDGRFVVTTDMMVHGPDFRSAWSTPHDLGWKAAASNLADVAAMGARPTALVVAIAAPVSSPVALLEGIADGFRDACAELAPGCGVVGGDLSVSDTLTIAVTAFGDLAGRPPVLRSGARVGDVVAISGDVGVAAGGIRLLFELGVDSDGVPDRARGERVRREHPVEVEAQLAPRPPIADGVLASLAGASAMLDVSDGLTLDAERIAEASGVAIDLDTRALAADVALAGGEDHSLLACFPADALLPGGFRAIGRVVSGSGLLVDGESFTVTTGWDPYVRWDGRTG